MSDLGRPTGPSRARPHVPPRYLKPPQSYCTGCALEHAQGGFVPTLRRQPAAPAQRPKILIVGEAPGYDEGIHGEPFVGAAGSMLTRVLKIIGHTREEYDFANVYSCFPGETLVESRHLRAVSRRWWEGSLVTLRLSNGTLSGTPNHPVLTPRGWVALGKLKAGDQVIGGALREGMAGGDPDVHDPPTRIEQVFRAAYNSRVAERVVGRDVDFHGDGSDEEVEIVYLDRVLRDAHPALRSQLFGECALVATDSHTGQRLTASTSERGRSDEVTWARRSTDCVVGRTDLFASLLGGKLPPYTLPDLATAAERYAVLRQRSRDATGADAVLSGQAYPRRPLRVRTSDVLRVEHQRWAGWVYNLHTASEEYVANGVIVHNCVLPGGTSERQPWAYSAREQCGYIRDTLLSAPEVVVPLGGVAIRRVLDLFGHKDVKVDGFHGTVTRSVDDRYWIVPGYHPSYLQRGAVNLMGVAAFDLSIAHEVAQQGWSPDPMQLVIDPPVDWFRAYADQYLAAVRQDPFAYPMANDIETPDKSSDEAEDIAAGRDKSYRIVRQNFSCDPNLGVTVPWEGEYITIATEILEARGLQYLWHKAYDVPRQLAAGIRLDTRRCYDGMWMAKVLQSDLPGGLGFWAPFYSRWGAWKHLAHEDPARYACIDGPQTRRVVDGLVADLTSSGMWHIFGRHQHDFHGVILQPATDIGVPIDRPKLAEFKTKLEGEATRLMEILQRHVPPEVCPETPKQGLSKPPVPGDLHAKARTHKRDGTLKKEQPDPLKAALYTTAVVVEKLVLRAVWQCQACEVIGVLKTHRCPDSRSSLWENDAKQAPDLLVKVTATVRRWFWQEPFNPDSAQQMLALLKTWKLAPGRNKHTGNDSVDRETLTKLLAKTQGTPQGEFFAAKLDYGAVVKVRSTYVVGTEKRLDDNDRLHSEVTFKPSMMRTSMVSPNLQNVVADKGGKDSLAAGFRHVVVARGQWVEEGSEYADAPD